MDGDRLNSLMILTCEWNITEVLVLTKIAKKWPKLKQRRISNFTITPKISNIMQTRKLNKNLLSLSMYVLHSNQYSVVYWIRVFVEVNFTFSLISTIHFHISMLKKDFSYIVYENTYNKGSILLLIDPFIWFFFCRLIRFFCRRIVPSHPPKIFCYLRHCSDLFAKENFIIDFIW